MRILVTGATSGIGRATTTLLRSRGHHVIALGRNAGALEELGGPSVQCDLARADEVAEAVGRLRQEEPLDALVNNAAEVVYEKSTKLSAEAWARLLQVNLLAAVQLVGGLVDHFAPNPHVVWVSSVTAGASPNARFAPYALTKEALDRYFEAVRTELVPRGGRATRIAPGLVDTPIYQKVDGFERTEARIRDALPRWLDAADVAETIAWALERPPHVHIASITIAPTGQVI